MSPRIIDVTLKEKVGFDVHLDRRSSFHQPIHLTIIHKNNRIRVKIYSDRDLYFEYGNNSSLSPGEKEQFEGWVSRNIDAIEYNWDLFCGRCSGQYKTDLE